MELLKFILLFDERHNSIPVSYLLWGNSLVPTNRLLLPTAVMEEIANIQDLCMRMNQEGGNCPQCLHAHAGDDRFWVSKLNYHYFKYLDNTYAPIFSPCFNPLRLASIK
jgi:hypothetical protein